MDFKKWKDHEFSTGCTAGDDYLDFQKAARTYLAGQLRKNGMSLYKFYKNHYEFSAVAYNPASERYGYISIVDVRYFHNGWFNDVLYRTMETPTDWTGGMNHYCSIVDVAKNLKGLLE